MIIMKKLVYIFGFLITFFACTDKKSTSEQMNQADDTNGFVINGKLDMEGVKKVKLLVNRKELTTAKVVDNKFVLQGKVDKPTKGVITDKDNSFNVTVILENDTFNLETKNNYAFIKGGKLHQEVLGFIAEPEFVKLNRELQKAEKEAFEGVSMLDHAGLKKGRELLKSVEDKVYQYENDYLNNIIENGSSAYAKLFALGESYDWGRYSVQKRLNLLDEYEKSIGKNAEIDMYRKVLKEDLNKADLEEQVKPGMPFKNVIAKDIDGKEVDLSKVVAANNFTILEYWASWCSPCRAEIPNLKNAYKKYKSKGLEIVSVSVDDRQKSWIKALEKEQLTWISTIAENGFKNKYVKEYGISSIPASYLIAKDGTILASNEQLREADLDKTLSTIILGAK